jgi:excisionase family DNA binding protein
MNKLLTIREAAEYLQTCQRSIYNYEKAGFFPIIRKGRFVRVDQADLEAFIEKCKRGEIS